MALVCNWEIRVVLAANKYLSWRCGYVQKTAKNGKYGIGNSHSLDAAVKFSGECETVFTNSLV